MQGKRPSLTRQPLSTKASAGKSGWSNAGLIGRLKTVTLVPEGEWLLPAYQPTRQGKRGQRAPNRPGKACCSFPTLPGRPNATPTATEPQHPSVSMHSQAAPGSFHSSGMRTASCFREQAMHPLKRIMETTAKLAYGKYVPPAKMEEGEAGQSSKHWGEEGNG